jgi:hypothetical protein
MDGQTGVGIVAAAIAFGAMVVSIWQAYVAKAQTKHAKEQVDEARKANELTEQLLNHEQAARRFHLDLSAKPEKHHDQLLYLVVRVENNCLQTANIQELFLVFGDGSTESDGVFDGEIKFTERNFFSRDLPGELEPGKYFTFRFCKLVEYGEQHFRNFREVPPDYSDSKWRNIDRIEIKSNNKVFTLTGKEDPQQPPHWKAQFENMTSPNAGH